MSVSTSSRPRTALRRSASVIVLGALAAGVLPGTWTPAAAADGLTATQLTTNGRANPLGIPGEDPSFSWALQGPARGSVQSAYELTVSRGDQAVWSSGTVASNDQTDIVYGGPDLQAATAYTWRVRATDGAGVVGAWSEPASFETGLLSAGDWGDAAWIGEGQVDVLADWHDYTATIDFSMTGRAFGTYLQSSDVNNGWMMQLSTVSGRPMWNPHTRINGGFARVASIDLSSLGFTVDGLRNGTHQLRFQTQGDQVVTYLDDVQIDSRNNPAFTRGLIGFRTWSGDQDSVLVRSVQVTADNRELLDYASGGPNPFTGGTSTADGIAFSGDTDTLFRTTPSLPLLRDDFELPTDKTVASARLYAAGQGIYEMTLNGQPVGDQHLAPGWTDYNQRIQSQTYDVTDAVRSGDNALGAALADGWYRGHIGLRQYQVYGNQLAVIARLHVTYTDGTDTWVNTGEDWTSHAGPYVAADLQDGETYDARLAQDGFTEAGYDATGWNPVAIRPSVTNRLVPQPDEPVRTTQVLTATDRTQPTPGAYVYNLGQNMVGVARVTLTGKAGQTVTIRYAEMLNPDGTLYTANFRAARVTDTYTFATDGTVTYTPTFTQHGFQYIEISGVDNPPATSAVQGEVWGSDLPGVSEISTSSTLVNQILSNASWSQRGNFLSIPTDTPARDERLGWTGDISIFGPTAALMRDTRAFLGKWMDDVRDSQYDNGDIPAVVPSPQGAFGAGQTGWSDAVVTVPYSVWAAHGDATIVRDNYAAMKEFLDYQERVAGSDLIDDTRASFYTNDWLNLGGDTPLPVMGTAYFAENARMMSEMAAAIGNTADAERYADLSQRVREAFTATLISPDGVISGNTQTSYALGLNMNLITDPAKRESAGQRLADLVAAAGDHLTTGFIGTPELLPALTAAGREDLAFALLLQTTYPSWGYEIAGGATTIWERWNSKNPDGSFGPVDMNSFNHYAYGSVAEWVWQRVAGITALEPGYSRSRIAPAIGGGGLTEANASLRTVHGELSSHWTTGEAGTQLDVTVPVNTTSQIVIPATSRWAVTEGGVPAAQAPGVTDAQFADGQLTLTVGSGSYSFRTGVTGTALAAIGDAVDAMDAQAAALSEAGTLTSGERNTVDGRVASLRTEVGQAITAMAAGDRAATGTALGRAAGLRGQLATEVGDVADRGSRDALTTALNALGAALDLATAEVAGLVVTVIPVDGPVRTGATVPVQVTVENRSTSTLTGATLDTEVNGWGTPMRTSIGDLAAGQSRTVDTQIAVPQAAAPGAAALRWTLAGTLGRALTATAEQPWATVASDITLGAVAVAPSAAGAGESVVVSVPVTNTATSPVTGRLQLVLPQGWTPAAPTTATVPAGATVPVQATTTVPISTRVAGTAGITAQFTRAGAVLGEAGGSIAVTVGAPAAGQFTDYVDFGDTASETAHGIQADARSGTSPEAGLTRRYTQTMNGSWFSAQVATPRSGPFALIIRETYMWDLDKRYTISVDGVSLGAQTVTRIGGAGSSFYRVYVDSAEALAQAADGSVRVRFQFDTAPGFMDASVADLWVVGAADTTAPSVWSDVTGAIPTATGWYQGAVQVALTAADGIDTAPRIEVRQGESWVRYTAPITVDRDGRTTVQFRAIDAAGNVSPVRDVIVPVDTTTPTTSAEVTASTGGARSLLLTASDATSGIEGIEYALNGGSFTAYTTPVAVPAAGATVTYRSTDVAGNVEQVKTLQVTAAPDRATARITSSSGGREGYFRGTVTVSLTAPAGTTVQYQVDGRGWRTATRTFTVSGDGQHTVEHRLLRGGNVVAGSEMTERFGIDTVAPRSVFSALPSDRAGTPRNPVTIAVTGLDSTSGVDRTEYRIDGGTWTPIPVSQRVTIDQVGDHTVDYRTLDRAGNVERTKTTAVLITADPATSVTLSASSLRAGSRLTVSVAGFTRSTQTAVYIDGRQVAFLTTDVRGAGRLTVTVPRETPAGTSTIQVTSLDGGFTAQATLTVRR